MVLYPVKIKVLKHIGKPNVFPLTARESRSCGRKYEWCDHGARIDQPEHTGRDHEAENKTDDACENYGFGWILAVHDAATSLANSVGGFTISQKPAA